MESAALASTRRSLHGVAELILAGPQHRRSGTIRLRVTPGGFSTVAEPEIRVEGDRLVADSTVVELGGATYRDAASAVGVVAVSLADVYSDGPQVSPDEVIDVDPAAARRLCSAFEVGNAALLQFRPDGEPVLWPEHFDLALSHDEVNYGVSPGDSAHPEPYAYVGPWEPRTGTFWTTPFGAILTLGEHADAEQVLGFFRQGEARAAER